VYCTPCTNNNNNNNLRRFPAHDELGTCRTTLVTPEQPVLCIPVRPCTVYHVLCTMYCVPCTVYHVLCTMYCVPCTVYMMLLHKVLTKSHLHAVGAAATLLFFAPSYPLLLTGRVMYGLGIGFAMHAAPAYIAETASASVRGLLIR